jgi:hypothetical protein
MPEYTVYERTRIDNKGEEKKHVKVKRFRLPMVLIRQKKGGPVEEIVLKKSTDMKFGDHIKKLGHIIAKSKKEAILKTMLGFLQKGKHA